MESNPDGDYDEPLSPLRDGPMRLAQIARSPPRRRASCPTRCRSAQRDAAAARHIASIPSASLTSVKPHIVGYTALLTEARQSRSRSLPAVYPASRGTRPSPRHVRGGRLAAPRLPNSVRGRAHNWADGVSVLVLKQQHRRVVRRTLAVYSVGSIRKRRRSKLQDRAYRLPKENRGADLRRAVSALAGLPKRSVNISLAITARWHTGCVLQMTGMDQSQTDSHRPCRTRSASQGLATCLKPAG